MPLSLARNAFRLGMFALALLIVLYWRIGPIMFAFDPPGPAHATHGVHAGDPLALLPALLAVPRRRLRLDRRVGVKAPLTPNPMRRAADRAR